MFLTVLSAIFLNTDISNKWSHLELRICPIPFNVIARFVVISKVCVKRVDCISLSKVLVSSLESIVF